MWEPIETAPDGGNILASNGRAIWLAWKGSDGRWREIGATLAKARKPLFWMPLPALPKAEASGYVIVKRHPLQEGE